MNWKNVEDPQFDQSAANARPVAQSGYTLVEVIVAVSLLGFMIVSLFAGFSTGFAVLRIARENMRATQILEERMEVLRLIKWDDVNSPGFIPTNFIAPFYPPDSSDATNSTASGIAYTGTVSVINAPIAETYAKNMRAIQINLTWTSGNITRSRQMTSYVSRYGLQNYVY
jgi:prepilin-type N-terminal cleavage/methylation domain-containing protein